LSGGEVLFSFGVVKGIRENVMGEGEQKAG
jgi:hypothetical protein